MNLSDVTGFAKQHPIETGAIVVGVGLAVLWLMSSGSSSGASGGDQLASAFYTAQANEAASGNALQAHQIDANAAVAIAGLQADVSKTNATTWATTDLQMNASNNQAATAGFPYAVEAEAIGAFAQVASLPPLTTQKKSSGFFGIGASKSISQTPNPIALNASSYLANIIGGNYAQH